MSDVDKWLDKAVELEAQGKAALAKAALKKALLAEQKERDGK